MEKYPYYAIEKIGSVKPRYVIKQVVSQSLTIPADARRFRTEEAARTAADTRGLNIAVTGDLYAII